MIHLPASVRVYLCLTPCDMRKSFDSLQALLVEALTRAGHSDPVRLDQARLLFEQAIGYFQSPRITCRTDRTSRIGLPEGL